jgi:sec-independent protein translocase protein TatA
MITPLIAGLGAQELVLILLVLVLLFGASKLPELARGSGRALRIFKAETKGLMDDEDDDAATKPEAQKSAELAQKQAELDAKQAELDAERRRLHGDSNPHAG